MPRDRFLSVSVSGPLHTSLAAPLLASQGPSTHCPYLLPPTDTRYSPPTPRLVAITISLMFNFSIRHPIIFDKRPTDRIACPERRQIADEKERQRQARSTRQRVMCSHHCEAGLKPNFMLPIPRRNTKRPRHPMQSRSEPSVAERMSSRLRRSDEATGSCIITSSSSGIGHRVNSFSIVLALVRHTSSNITCFSYFHGHVESPGHHGQ